MISPISLFLPEFSPPVAGPEQSFEAAPDLDAFDMPLAEPEMLAVDPEELIAQARADGFAEGSATLETALAAQAAALEAQHAQELELARARWTLEAAGEFAAALQSALDDLEQRLATGVAEVLEPAIGLAMRRRVSEDLHQALSSLIAMGQGTIIRLTGPADLVEPLRVAFEGRATIEAQVTDAGEVEIESDGTLIRSQLASWAETLRSGLEETS